MRQPRRRGRWRALDGCQARPAGDSAGAAEEGRAALRRGTAWPDASRKGAVCGLRVAQNAPFRDVAARGARSATPRRPAGHYEKWPNWANALEQPPARLRGGAPGLAGLGLGPGRTERRSRSVHKSAKTASRRWSGAFVYTVASELHWVTRVSQPPWDACGTDGVLLQQGTHSTRREDQMCVACVYPAHFYLLALDARRGRCRCDVSDSLTSQS